MHTKLIFSPFVRLHVLSVTQRLTDNKIPIKSIRFKLSKIDTHKREMQQLGLISLLRGPNPEI